MRTSLSTSSLSRTAAVAAAFAVVATGCAAAQDNQEQIAELRAELDTRAGTERVLIERIDELEGQIGALRDASADDPTRERLDAVDDELARLADAVSVVESDVAAEAGDRAALGEELNTNVSDLRSSLVELQASVDEIGGSIDELHALYASLRDRLDRLQRDG